MSETLVNVTVTSETKLLIKRCKDISPAFGEIVSTIASNAVKGTTELALKAYKSKVPIDTLELRGRNLDDGFIQKTFVKSSMTGKVFIKEGTHLGRDGKPFSSTKLAEKLNLHPTYKRTRDSAAIDNYGAEGRRSPTKGWKDKAYNAFISPAKLGNYLRTTDFSRNIV